MEIWFNVWVSASYSIPGWCASWHVAAGTASSWRSWEQVTYTADAPGRVWDGSPSSTSVTATTKHSIRDSHVQRATIPSHGSISRLCCILRGNKTFIPASPVALVVKNPPANAGDLRDCRLNPGVEKIPRRRAWQPSLVFFHGESHGQRSLAGYKSKGSWRVRHDGSDLPWHGKTLIWAFSCHAASPRAKYVPERWHWSSPWVARNL